MTPRQFFIGVILAVLLAFALGTCSYGAPVWTGIVVHHTASPEWTTVEAIDQWHKDRGWDGIGYNFVIYTDGTVAKGRPLDRPGAHAEGRNSTHLGIALVGYYDFTGEQLASLLDLCARLCISFPIRTIEAHHENCPGPGVDILELNAWCIRAEE